MSTLKLAVGKNYLNRRGDLVTITDYRYQDTAYPFADSSGSRYAENGQYAVTTHPAFDLVPETAQ